MSAKISHQFRDGLTGQGRLMVQTLVSSACTMLAAGGGRDERGNGHGIEDYARLLEQLTIQRKLAAEIVTWEIAGADDRFEAVNQQWLIDELCRRAQIRILELQAAEAETAGDADRLRFIARQLEDLKAVDNPFGSPEEGRPIPWLAEVVVAA
jgi:hypothetical protein